MLLIARGRKRFEVCVYDSWKRLSFRNVEIAWSKFGFINSVRMDYITFSRNSITHISNKLSWYYMFPLQRTSTHLVCVYIYIYILHIFCLCITIIYVYGSVWHTKTFWNIWSSLTHITNLVVPWSIARPTCSHGTTHNWRCAFVDRVFVGRAFVSLCRVGPDQHTCIGIMTPCALYEAVC
jgi:hypothetical protein